MTVFVTKDMHCTYSSLKCNDYVSIGWQNGSAGRNPFCVNLATRVGFLEHMGSWKVVL